MDPPLEKIKKLEYPYYSIEYKFNKKKYLEEFKKFKPTIYREIPKEIYSKNLSKYDKAYFLIKTNYSDEQLINNLTDYFSEKVRVKCQFLGYTTPLEYWKNNKDDIIKTCQNKFNHLTIHNLREIIFANTKLCNNFRITVGTSVIDYFKPKSWLDISAGWGDRLITAILNNVELYVAADPNLELHKCYTNIINKLVSKTKRKNYQIHPTGFIEALIVQKDFDIVFSSPPFFDLEKYSTYTQDSYTQFNTQRSWTDNFLIKSIIKSYNLLKPNGYMILYIGHNDEYAKHKINKLNNLMRYHGVMYFYEKKPRGMYVWEKIKNNHITDSYFS
jgi:16S rRNA G966 N2-methylase RsmD